MTLFTAAMLLGAAFDQPPTPPRAAENRIVVDRAPPRPAPPGADQALAMFSGHDALATCGEKVALTRRLVCASWINGAMAASQFAKSTLPFAPDFCNRPGDGNLGTYGDLFVAYLRKNQKQLADPAIVLFRQAMAERYPCGK